MNIDKTLEKVERVLRGIKGTLDVKRLSSEHRDKILDLERTFEEASNESRCYYNEGIREVLEKREVMVLIHSLEFRHPPTPFVKWRLGGVEVGEEVWDAKSIEELKENKNVLFIGKTFIIRRDRLKNSPLKNFEVLFPPLPFPELEGLDGIRDAVSASPSCLTDIYIKHVMELDDKLGIIFIGFDLSDSS
ncbi:MAG: hypothetical protein ACUVWK_00440 [Nitrososphaerales archaeon]